MIRTKYIIYSVDYINIVSYYLTMYVCINNMLICGCMEVYNTNYTNYTNCVNVVLLSVQSKSILKLGGPEKFVIIIVPGFISVWWSSSLLNVVDNTREEGKTVGIVRRHRSSKLCFRSWEIYDVIARPNVIREPRPLLPSSLSRLST